MPRELDIRGAEMAMRRWIIAVTGVLLGLNGPASAAVRYVKASATGADNGTSWTDAYTDLQSALTAAVSGDEIWVAGGTYKPTTGSDRTATFQLKSSVKLYGGLPGQAGQEGNFAVRDIVANETILSGDLSGNDVNVSRARDLFSHSSRQDNSYHILTGTSLAAGTVLDGFIIRGGNTKSGPINHGGAIRLTSSALAIRNCTFNANSAGYGGGISALAGGSTATSCVFSGNGADDGGGVYAENDGIVQFTSCKFFRNEAVNGGGIENYSSGQPQLVNCLFSGNYAYRTDGNGGGAFYGCRVYVPGVLTATNCTFVGNGADVNGGGLRSLNGYSIVLRNCILWGNTGPGGTNEAAQVYYPAQVYDSCIQGWTGTMTPPQSQAHVINTDPFFVDADGVDNVFGTLDDNPRLTDGSPCIDAGSNASVPADIADLDADGNTTEPTSHDLDATPRIVDNPNSGAPGQAIVDMGAYEAHFTQEFLVASNPITVPENSVATFTVALAQDPGQTVAAAVSWSSGDSDIVVASPSGGTLSFDSGNYSTPQTVTLAAAEDIDFISSTTLFTISGTGLPTFILTAREVDNDTSQPLLVKAGATGGNNGMSWQDAYTSLQSALDAAAASGGLVKEIWVAAGTYKPTKQTLTGDPRSVTFQMIEGVAIYGGFSGVETARTQRNPAVNETVLSGDIGVVGTTTDNCYRVVTADVGLTSAAILDGFAIRDGYANAVTYSGSGMMIRGSNPSVSNCTFVGNSAKDYGGGLYLTNDGMGQSTTNTPTLVNCRFLANSAGQDGGGLYVGASRPVLVNCVFMGNKAINGGGACFSGCAGCQTSFPYPRLHGCVFVGNQATSKGGAIHNIDHSYIYLMNCTLTGNVAATTGGVHNENAGSTSLQQSILWGNSDDSGWVSTSQFYDAGGSEAYYSCIQGGWTDVGSNNISTDPLLTPDGHLKSGSSCIDAGNPAFTASPDAPADRDGDARVLDGNGDATAVVDIGADEWKDANGNRLPDWWETTYPAAATPGGDADGDGYSNLAEYEDYSSLPATAPVYVDTGNAGDPAQNGTLAHPFDTLQKGIDKAGSGGTVLVRQGTYAGAGNRALDLKAKAVLLRAWDGTDPSQPATATIDCGGAGRAIDLATVGGPMAGIEGLAIQNGFVATGGGEGGAARMQASRLTLKHCSLADNVAPDGADAISANRSNLRLDDLTIGMNTGGSGPDAAFSHNTIFLSGDVLLTEAELLSESNWFDGPGSIELGQAGTFRVTGSAANAPATIFRSTMHGLGTVQIDAGQQMTLEGNGLIDLSDGQGHIGNLSIDGKLLVQGNARLQNTGVTIRQAEITTTQPVQYNDIRMIDGMAAGGELLVQDSATVADNSITSEGDRYLDMDPDPQTGHPTILRNRTTVQIKTSPNVQRGTLLELRASDYDCGTPTNPDCQSGARHAPSSAGFTSDPSANWVLEKLEIQTDSKLNLTNRPGLQYQTDYTHPETVYVKDLVLYPNAYLNTALQSLYYENLKDEDGNTLDRDNLPGGRKIVDIPLLGFSLGIIAMDDTTASPFNEFDVRVRRRIRDNGDVQPDPPAPAKEGAVERISSSQVQAEVPSLSGVGGAMQMRTQATDQVAASSVAAKGSFARAGDEDITIIFEYLFMDNPNAVLVVKLSDKPDVDTRSFEVARVKVPATGRPGSIGSGQFGTFYGTFPRVTSEYTLNFTRGTYVELELRGDKDSQGNTIPPVASRVWIDNFDPQIRCSYACADLSGEGAVTGRDFMLALAEAGQTVADRQNQQTNGRYIGCMDNRLAEDGYVDISDVLAFDSIIRIPAPPQACGPFNPPSPAPAPMKSLARSAKATSQPIQPADSGGPASLVVAGKSGMQIDGLYALDKTSGASTGCPQNPVGGAGSRGNGRVIRDGERQLYQLNAIQCLVRQDGAVIVGPKYFGNVSIDGASGCQVHVGLNAPGGQYAGLPLADAAFDPDQTSPTSVYVVPVLVTPPASSGHCPYRAAARLDLTGGGNYEIGQIYGKDPFTYSSVLPSDCEEVTALGFVWEPDRQPVREIEVDAAGTVYVLAARSGGSNDWLLTYSSAGGNGSEVAVTLTVPGPAALLASSKGNGLYLTSTLTTQAMAPALPTTRVYRLNTAGVIQGYTDVTHPTIGTPDTGYGFVATITAMTEDTDGRVYAVGYSSPRYNNEKTFANNDPLFTTATLASFLPTDTTAIASTIGATGLALPLSTAFGTVSTGSATPGDLTCDGHVDSADLAIFAPCASGSNVPRASNCAGADYDDDGDVDMNDFGILQRCWSGPDAAPGPSCIQ